MTDHVPALASESLVPTERAARYGKQLASHLGRKAISEWDEEAGRGSIIFSEGRGRAELVAEGACLRLQVYATPESVANLEDVVGRHLVRFGARDELVVTWTRADGSAGTEQRKTEDD